MVVRHPFERVLSAYRDKLEDWEPADSAFPRMVKKRIGKYRDNPNKKKEDNITFTEYIRFISELGRSSSQQQNEHWLPMHELCEPCSIQYDFISKFENLQEDSEYLLNWMGATDPKYKFPPAARPFHSSRYDPKYFGQLGHKEIKAFYAKYVPDFLLFDYDLLWFWKALPICHVSSCEATVELQVASDACAVLKYKHTKEYKRKTDYTRLLDDGNLNLSMISHHDRKVI